MPETSMNENDLAQPWENHVWYSWEVARMKPVPEPHSMGKAADNHLGARVLALHASHPLATFLFREIVHRQDDSTEDFIADLSL